MNEFFWRTAIPFKRNIFERNLTEMCKTLHLCFFWYLLSQNWSVINAAMSPWRFVIIQLLCHFLLQGVKELFPRGLQRLKGVKMSVNASAANICFVRICRQKIVHNILMGTMDSLIWASTLKMGYRFAKKNLPQKLIEIPKSRLFLLL